MELQNAQRAALTAVRSNLRRAARPDLTERLRLLSRSAESVGVELMLDVKENKIWLSRIERTRGVRGAGSIILEELRDIADEYDCTISGIVEPQVESLIEYYVDQDFEVHTSNGRSCLSYP